jgi:hypothetical protein
MADCAAWLSVNGHNHCLISRCNGFNAYLCVFIVGVGMPNMECQITNWFLVLSEFWTMTTRLILGINTLYYFESLLLNRYLYTIFVIS